jgi:tight adherence protein C
VSAAPLLAALAGVLAAAGLVDLAAARRADPPRRGEDRAAEAAAGGPRSAGSRASGDVGGRRAPAGRRRGGARLSRLGLRALERLGRGVGSPVAPDGLREQLDAAGAPFGLAVADLMALKAGAALAGALAGLPVASLAPGRLGIVVLAGAPVAGFLLPDLALRRRARARGATVELELPDVAELLRVAVQAGLPPARALHEIGRRHPGLLAAELRAAADRIALGVPRADALARLAARAPAPGVAALTAALLRAAEHGAPLGPSLAAIAADARAARTRRVRERAARAAPKIQLVVALLLVPAVLLLVAAALVASLG